MALHYRILYYRQNPFENKIYYISVHPMRNNRERFCLQKVIIFTIYQVNVLWYITQCPKNIR
jgi:hypothetical protein